MMRGMKTGALLAAAMVAGLAGGAHAEAPGAKLMQVGLVVSDLDRATKFYTEALGFKAEGDVHPIPPALAKLLEQPADMDMKIRFLTKDGVKIELITFANPKVEGSGQRRKMNQAGLSHLAVAVDDFDATVAAIKANGGKLVEETLFAPPGAGKFAFATDPDGTRIEIQAPAKK
jgi:catechol 2,3-dioxygenase-like lactoylglutathione lyase family enzyme